MNESQLNGPVFNPVDGQKYWFAYPEDRTPSYDYYREGVSDVVLAEAGRVFDTYRAACERFLQDGCWVQYAKPVLPEEIQPKTFYFRGCEQWGVDFVFSGSPDVNHAVVQFAKDGNLFFRNPSGYLAANRKGSEMKASLTGSKL